MSDDKDLPAPVMQWYSAAVRYFVHGLTMPDIYATTVPAFSRKEAVELVSRQFMQASYDPKEDVWHAPDGLPITPWRVDVVEIPEPYAGALRDQMDRMLREIDKSTTKRRRRKSVKSHDNVVELFPRKGPEDPDTPPPEDSDPKV